MKICDSLSEIIQFIKHRHPYISQTKGGVYAMKLLRRNDGSRIPFEEMNGFKIFNMLPFGENGLVVESLAAGYAFKGSFKHTVSSKLFLHNLAVINVYDHKTEFYSIKGIDFVYIENTYDSQVQMLQEWIDNDPGILRAQWCHNNTEIEKILHEISVGARVERQISSPRLLDLNHSFSDE